MTIDEGVIRAALLRATPADLDDILTTIEAYRACVTTAHRLHAARGMRQQRDHVIECAGHCRRLLEDYAETGWMSLPEAPATAHMVFSMKW